MNPLWNQVNIVLRRPNAMMMLFEDSFDCFYNPTTDNGEQSAHSKLPRCLHYNVHNISMNVYIFMSIHRLKLVCTIWMCCIRRSWHQNLCSFPSARCQWIERGLTQIAQGLCHGNANTISLERLGVEAAYPNVCVWYVCVLVCLTNSQFELIICVAYILQCVEHRRVHLPWWWQMQNIKHVKWLYFCAYQSQSQLCIEIILVFYSFVSSSHTRGLQRLRSLRRERSIANTFR